MIRSASKVQISHAIGARLLSNCVPICYNAPFIDSFRFWSAENGRGRKGDDIHLTPHASLTTRPHQLSPKNRAECVWRWASLNNVLHSTVSAFFALNVFARLFFKKVDAGMANWSLDHWLGIYDAGFKFLLQWCLMQCVETFYTEWRNKTNWI